MSEAESQQNNQEIEEEVVKEAQREPIEVSITDIELEELKQEASEYKDKYLRLLAETENARKRMRKELEDHGQYSVCKIVNDILPPMDNLENALGYADKMSDEVKNWALGFQMILEQFKEALNSHGITALDSYGKEFDPHLHDAIEMLETDEHEAGTVVEEISKGYIMGSRTVRPARVVVAKAPSSPETETEQEEQDEEKVKE